MFRKSVIEESLLYRLIWELFSSSLSIGALFAIPIYFFQLDRASELKTVLAIFLVGIIAGLLAGTFNSRLVKFVAHFLPYLSLVIGLVYTEPVLPQSFTWLFIVFTIYSLAAAVGSEFYESGGPSTKTISFSFIQFNRLLSLAGVFLILENEFDGRLFVFDLGGMIFENTSPIIYLMLNLCFISISFFLTMLQLIARNAQLALFSKELKHLSSWSLDNKIIEQQLGQSRVNLIHETKTIVFGDIRGFTSYSETNDIASVLKILENLYTIVESNVKKYSGFKPEFIADEFITFFDKNEDAVAFAVNVAQDINDYLQQFNLSAGLGLDRGKVLEGIVGGENSKKYTVIGRAVNTASRLQSFAEGRQILVSARVIKNLRSFKVEKLKPIKLKGIKQKLEVYNLITASPGRKNKLQLKLFVNNIKSKLFAGSRL